MTGTFITFEGPEGAGKTTQIERLAMRLKSAGRIVNLTREPGGTPAGEALRDVLLSPEMDWSPLGEALLMNAARDAHLHQVILPAMLRGEVVLCDRFADSTRAYQGAGGDLPEPIIDALEAAVCVREPDLTLMFDLPPQEGLARAAARGRADRFEAKGAAYHERVAAGFRQIVADNPLRCALIDAQGSIEDVERRIDTAIREKLPGLLHSPA